MKKIALFASGSGTNMENIIKRVKAKKLHDVEISLVFSDKENAPALEKARKHGIDTLHLNPKVFRSKEEYERMIYQELKDSGIEYVILAGYMRIISPFLIKKFKNRMLNIHPSLLPVFKGAYGIKDAFDAGVKTSGVTVHFVTDELDGGPILLQKKVRILKSDTLASFEKRIHKAEYEIYPKAIARLVQGKI